jgi:uncharacterized protein YcbK (DUF882 family)
MKNLKTPTNFTLDEYLNYGSRSVMPIKDRELIKKDFEALTEVEQQNCLKILFALQEVRDKYGKSIFITCGYRSVRHEKLKNRSGGSMHSKGAVDITANDMKALNDAIGDWNGGYKWYKEQNFIHLDLGRKRRW